METADSAAAAEEEEKEARAEETRAAGLNCPGGHHSRDALQQESQNREEEARTVQPRGLRGGEVEHVRMTGNGRGVTTRRLGDGSGREGRTVSRDSQRRRAGISRRAGPGAAAWRTELSVHE
ncbi:unnamed protein product [Closterium sp. Naga37s-1]|nr:unnamed protein product [Closterium sp. Naga37s-1]